MICVKCRTRIRETTADSGSRIRDCAPTCPVQRNRVHARNRYRAAHPEPSQRHARPVPVVPPRVPVPAPPPAVLVTAPRCPRDGCGLIRVETHRDWSLSRRRAVFACGFDAWEPVPPRATRPEGVRPCHTCGDDFTPSAECRKVCPRCHVCTRCGGGRDAITHAVAACPKRVAA